MLDEHQQPDLGMLEHGNEAMVDHHSVHEHFDTHPSTGGCNLIVNYLPHDIDDLSLKVIVCNVFERDEKCVTLHCMSCSGPFRRIWRDHHHEGCDGPND